MADIHSPAHEPYLSKVQMPSGTEYYLHDDCAHKKIEDLDKKITGSVSYLGKTTTEIIEGSKTNPIVIGGESVTAKSGDIVLYGDKEFLYTEDGWAEFGDQKGLKSMAFADSASTEQDYVPSGSVSSTPTYTETPINITYKPSGEATTTLDYTSTTASTTVTPTGTISKVVTEIDGSKISGEDNTATKDDGLTFFEATISDNTLILSCTKKKITNATATKTAPTFTGEEATIEVAYDKATSASSTFTGTEATITANYDKTTSVTSTFTGTGAKITVKPDAS